MCYAHVLVALLLDECVAVRFGCIKAAMRHLRPVHDGGKKKRVSREVPFGASSNRRVHVVFDVERGEKASVASFDGHLPLQTVRKLKKIYLRTLFCLFEATYTYMYIKPIKKSSKKLVCSREHL